MVRVPFCDGLADPSICLSFVFAGSFPSSAAVSSVGLIKQPRWTLRVLRISLQSRPSRVMLVASRLDHDVDNLPFASLEYACQRLEQVFALEELTEPPHDGTRIPNMESVQTVAKSSRVVPKVHSALQCICSHQHDSTVCYGHI
jgi:hypothetical protein